MWDELCDVILDVEVQINRRPLSYVEDDTALPTLTPTSFLFQRTSDLKVNLGGSKKPTYANEPNT